MTLTVYDFAYFIILPVYSMFFLEYFISNNLFRTDMEIGNIYALRNKPGTTEFLAGASLEIFKKALAECARQKYNSERVDAAVKLLYPCFNKPNEYSLADVWVRSVALNVVIRSLDRLGSIFTTTANEPASRQDFQQS